MLVVYNIGNLVTMKGENSLRTGSQMTDVGIIKDGYLVVENGRFIEIGSGLGYKRYSNASMVDAKGKLVTPGLIDSHTHLVHAGSREHEFSQKLQGVSYLDILKQGGGILNTVAKTQKASTDELFSQALTSLNTMLRYGVTTVEAKSGYGLELETELKQLEVAKKLNKFHPVDIVSTFMGAHAIPPIYQNNREEYIDKIKTMIKVVKEQDLAIFCDVFCEEGVFTLAETEDILTFANSLGLKLKIHADEMVPLGGAGLAAKLKCHSADHLMASTSDDLIKMAEAKVVANLLPLTSFYLDKPYAKARIMIENNCGVAIATDYNPGSSPSENLQLAMQIASIKMKLTPEEVITATTINAAVSLGVEVSKGSIEMGKDADFVIFNCPNLDYLIYHFGINHVLDVYIKGKQVVRNQKIVGGLDEVC